MTDPFSLWLFRTGSQTIFDACRIRAAEGGLGTPPKVAGLDAQAAGDPCRRRRRPGLSPRPARRRDGHAHGKPTARCRRPCWRKREQFRGRGVTPAIDLTRNEVNSRPSQSDLLTARNEQAARAARPAPRPQPAARRSAVALDRLARLAAVDRAARRRPRPCRFALAHRTESPPSASGPRRCGACSPPSAENLPSIGFSGYVPEVRTATDSMLAAATPSSSASGLPFFDGFRRQTRHSEQAIRLEAQQLREHDVTRQAEQEVRHAVLDLGVGPSSGGARRPTGSGLPSRNSARRASASTPGRRQRRDHQCPDRRRRGARRADPGAGELRRRPHRPYQALGVFDHCSSTHRNPKHGRPSR